VVVNKMVKITPKKKYPGATVARQMSLGKKGSKVKKFAFKSPPVAKVKKSKKNA
jgi:hypothetical protein